jgi:hypothetical protein
MKNLSMSVTLTIDDNFIHSNQVHLIFAASKGYSSFSSLDRLDQPVKFKIFFYQLGRLSIRLKKCILFFI